MGCYGTDFRGIPTIDPSEYLAVKFLLMTLYNWLVLIHVFSAILGMGPGFILIFVAKSPQNLTELRHGFRIRARLHIFVMIGGTLLLLSGLMMGYLNPALFQAFWYVTSLVLFLVALAFGPLVLSPRSKPIKILLKEQKGDEIPPGYPNMVRNLFFWERIENTIFLIIILLMILKPYTFESLLRMFYLK